MDLVALGESIGVRGFLHFSEAERLMELAAGKETCEIGAYTGLSCWLMAFTAKNVTSVDTHKAATNGTRQTESFTTLEDFIRATARFKNVTMVVATSGDAAQTVTVPFDFIFIDADHTYEGVLDDIQRWYPKLKPGGTIAFHDYRHGDYPGVEKAVDEIFGPAPEGTTVGTLRWVIKP